MRHTHYQYICCLPVFLSMYHAVYADTFYKPQIWEVLCVLHGPQSCALSSQLLTICLAVQSPVMTSITFLLHFCFFLMGPRSGPHLHTSTIEKCMLLQVHVFESFSLYNVKRYSQNSLQIEYIIITDTKQFWNYKCNII